MSDSKISRLDRKPYISLVTFRKNGSEVPTPVWFAERYGKLYVYTNVTSGKVKRIRNGARVRLAPCDLRGSLRGDWTDARARMLEAPQEMDAGLRAVERKYGWQMRLALLTSRVSGRYSQRACIEIEL